MLRSSIGIVIAFAISIPLISDDRNPQNVDPVTEPAPLKPVTAIPLLLSTPQKGDEPQPSSSDARESESDSEKRAPTPSPSTEKVTTETRSVSLDDRIAVESGFRPLLVGEELTGWSVLDGRKEAWVRNNSVISCTGSGGGWLYTERQYSDFHLKFEYLLQPGGNSGVGIRTPSKGNPSFDGIEIQLIDETAEKYANLSPKQRTGSLYYQVAPRKAALTNRPGEWNSCEIVCLSDNLTVKINGNVVTRASLSRPNNSAGDAKRLWRLAERPPVGHIAFQSHSTPVAFRNLRLRDLTTETESGVRYVDLTFGKGDAIDGNSNVAVHYTGQLSDGRRFADTRDLGDPVPISFNEVIPGWKSGMIGMKPGGKRRLIVPPEQGFGEEGAGNLIPPGATLVFEVELCDVQR